MNAPSGLYKVDCAESLLAAEPVVYALSSTSLSRLWRVSRLRSVAGLFDGREPNKNKIVNVCKASQSKCKLLRGAISCGAAGLLRSLLFDRPSDTSLVSKRMCEACSPECVWT